MNGSIQVKRKAEKNPHELFASSDTCNCENVVSFEECLQPSSVGSTLGEFMQKQVKLNKNTNQHEETFNQQNIFPLLSVPLVYSQHWKTQELGYFQKKYGRIIIEE